MEAEAGGPSAGTRVVATFEGQTLEMSTDADGRFAFRGIRTQANSSTAVHLVYVGADGVTIIWIEHVLHALISVVERLLVLDFGRVIGIGEPEAIMASREVREIYLGIEI